MSARTIFYHIYSWGFSWICVFLHNSKIETLLDLKHWIPSKYKKNNKFKYANNTKPVEKNLNFNINLLNILVAGKK